MRKSLLRHIWSLFSAAGFVVCMATLLGFLGQFSWFLDLFSHFRVQYLLGLLALGVLFAAARRHKAAVIFLIVACINAGVVLPLYVGRSSTSVADQGVAVRVMLLNVNTQLGDPERVKQAIQNADPDIIVLEEISFRWVKDLIWLSGAYPNSCIQPRSDNFGIGIFSKYPLEDSEVVIIGDAQVPSIVTTVNVSHTKLTVVATHPLPPSGVAYSRWRDDQLDKLPDHIREKCPAILVGDLNATPWSYHFRRLLKRSGLNDSTKGWGVQPSWSSHSPIFRIPIDHCLHSPDVSVVGRQIGDYVGSDHYPLIVDLVIDRSAHGARRDDQNHREDEG
jgi:endonuclease/exonuclease/phosphatase (EEP) superfamily protein YafD